MPRKQGNRRWIPDFSGMTEEKWELQNEIAGLMNQAPTF
jgi:hypothetical protein